MGFLHSSINCIIHISDLLHQVSHVLMNTFYLFASPSYLPVHHFEVFHFRALNLGQYFFEFDIYDEQPVATTYLYLLQNHVSVVCCKIHDVHYLHYATSVAVIGEYDELLYCFITTIVNYHALSGGLSFPLPYFRLGFLYFIPFLSLLY